MYRKRSIGWTIGLSVGLVLIVVIQLCVFIVGPQLKFQKEQDRIQGLIHEEIKSDAPVYRHVFEHIAYTTQDSNYVYWFNNQGELVKKEDTDTLQLSKVESIASDYGIDNPSIHIGYGYDKPAYEIVGDDAYLVVDYESLDVIHLRKGK